MRRRVGGRKQPRSESFSGTDAEKPRARNLRNALDQGAAQNTWDTCLDFVHTSLRVESEMEEGNGEGAKRERDRSRP